MARIDHNVGLVEATPAASFGNCAFERATREGKGSEKPLESHCCWNSDLLLGVAAEIDCMCMQTSLKTLISKQQHHLLTATHLICPIGRHCDSLWWQSWGRRWPCKFETQPDIASRKKGKTPVALPPSLKLNLTSPQERKARGQSNFRCPMLQVALIDCLV